MALENKEKHKLFFFDKKALSEPLSERSKYVEHLADNDPENPGRLLFCYSA